MFTKIFLPSVFILIFSLSAFSQLTEKESGKVYNGPIYFICYSVLEFDNSRIRKVREYQSPVCIDDEKYAEYVKDKIWSSEEMMDALRQFAKEKEIEILFDGEEFFAPTLACRGDSNVEINVTDEFMAYYNSLKKEKKKD